MKNKINKKKPNMFMYIVLYLWQMIGLCPF